MNTETAGFSPNQLTFKDIAVGTLIYAVVLGFLDDYTDLVTAKSFSTIFLASLVLSILTWLTFLLKNKTLQRLKGREGGSHPLLIGFCIWLILFFSKFVFLDVIDIFFGDDIDFRGFAGIVVTILLVTILTRLADFIFLRLGHDPLDTA